eukprot:1161625-Pelagomonas_calceolata.AAC.17
MSPIQPPHAALGRQQGSPQDILHFLSHRLHPSIFLFSLTCSAGSTAGSTTREARGSSTAAGTVTSISILASMASEVEVRGTTASNQRGGGAWHDCGVYEQTIAMAGFKHQAVLWQPVHAY